MTVAGATSQSVGGTDTPPCIQHVPRTAIYTGIYSVSLASGHFPVACELQAYHLPVRSINLICNHYPVLCGDTVFFLQCVHLNVTIQDICEALSRFISKTGIYSLETKGKVSSACCTCRNVSVKSRSMFSFSAKMIILLSCPSVMLIIYLLNPATVSGSCQQCTCRK